SECSWLVRVSVVEFRNDRLVLEPAEGEDHRRGHRPRQQDHRPDKEAGPVRGVVVAPGAGGASRRREGPEPRGERRGDDPAAEGHQPSSLQLASAMRTKAYSAGK